MTNKGKRARRVTYLPTVAQVVEQKMERLPAAQGGHWVWRGTVNNGGAIVSQKTQGHEGHVNVRKWLLTQVGVETRDKQHVEPTCGVEMCVLPAHMRMRIGGVWTALSGKVGAPVLGEPVSTPTVAPTPVVSAPAMPMVAAAPATQQWRIRPELTAAVTSEFTRRQEAFVAARGEFTSSAIAYTLGVSDATVYHALRQAGLSFREVRGAYAPTAAPTPTTAPTPAPPNGEQRWAAALGELEALNTMAKELRERIAGGVV